MEKTIVKTDNYLLVVDDSVINLDDWVYTDTEVLFQYGIEHKLNPSTKKVIAHLPLGMYSTLEGVPLLPPIEEDEEELVDKLFVNEVNSLEKIPNSNALEVLENGFKHGYNKAREKYKFTEDDLWVVFNYGRSNMHEETFESVIKRVSQPKTPTHFDFEMEKDYRYNDDGEPIGFKVHDSNVIKTTTNSQGQQVACGKYIY